MGDVYKTMYQGQLPSAVTVLATVPSAKAWIVKHISVVNTDTVTRTFALYRSGTAAANLITPSAISVPAGGSAEWDGTMALEAAASIAGIASAAGQMTTTICGDEVS